MDYACSMKIKIHSIQNLSREVSPRDAADRANQNQGETKMKKEAMKPARVQPLAKYSDQELRRIARDTLRHSLQMKGKEMDLVEADIVALTEKGRTYRCGKQNYSYADFDGHDLAMYTIYHEGSEGAEKHLRSVRDAAKERVRKLEEKIFREDEIVRWFSTAIRQHKALLRSIGAIR